MKDMRSNAKFFSEIAPNVTISIDPPVESFEQPFSNVFEEDDNEVPVRSKRQILW